MKIRIELLMTSDGSPHNRPNEIHFENDKEYLEGFISNYAECGILPRINESIHGIHTDGGIAEYKVISVNYFDDEILIFLNWE